MKYAIDETNRRRKKQQAYNDAHGIKPMSIIKGIYDISERLTTSAAIAEDAADYKATRKNLPKNELKHVLAELEREMKEAAKNLQFERAAELRGRDERFALETSENAGGRNRFVESDFEYRNNVLIVIKSFQS